ncbi:MAG: hypothetical protein ACPGUH_05475 [Winogradskyella sp.]
MQNDAINDLFEDLKGEFNTETPNQNHELRFIEKLNATNLATHTSKKSFGFNWRPFLAIAASIIICIGVYTTLQHQPKVLDLANVSPKLSETQDFFTVTLQNELKKLNNERSPLTDTIINDALKQIKILETNYKKLKIDLTESGKDQRVIYAMISNFQSRIEILTSVLEQIESVKQLKTNTNKTFI